MSMATSNADSVSAHSRCSPKARNRRPDSNSSEFGRGENQRREKSPHQHGLNGEQDLAGREAARAAAQHQEIPGPQEEREGEPAGRTHCEDPQPQEAQTSFRCADRLIGPPVVCWLHRTGILVGECLVNVPKAVRTRFRTVGCIAAPVTPSNGADGCSPIDRLTSGRSMFAWLVRHVPDSVRGRECTACIPVTVRRQASRSACRRTPPQAGRSHLAARPPAACIPERDSANFFCSSHRRSSSSMSWTPPSYSLSIAPRYSSTTSTRTSRAGTRERCAMSSTMRWIAPIADSSVSAERIARRISRLPTPATAWQRACALPQKPNSPQYLQFMSF